MSLLLAAGKRERFLLRHPDEDHLVTHPTLFAQALRHVVLAFSPLETHDRNLLLLGIAVELFDEAPRDLA